MNQKIKNMGWSYFLVTVGSFLTAAGLVMFLIPNKIASGGVSGLATVIYYVFNLPVGGVILFINIPLFLLAVRVMGRHIGAKTLWAILVLSFSIEIMTPALKVLTHDPLLASLYGGAITGFGMGLVFRAGGTTGGTDLVAALLNHYLPNLSLGQGLFAVDAFVVALAGIVFNAELALYAVIAIFVSSRVIDLVQEGFNISKSAFIISNHPEDITEVILKRMERGVTVLKGYGGYSGKEKNILLVTISRSELTRLKRMIYEIDPRAFVILINAHEVLGEGFKDW